MKLLTNFKDYYDFVIQKYGIDEKAFFERVKSTEYEIGQGVVYALAICGYIYVVAKIQGKFYFGDAIDINFINKVDNWWSYDFGGHYEKVITEHGKKTNLNDMVGKPILLLNLRSGEANFDMHDLFEKSSGGTFYFTINKYSDGVRLIDFGIDKIVEPENMFIQITNFLLKENDIKNNQTDSEKIVSHGFDVKRSFRPKMK